MGREYFWLLENIFLPVENFLIGGGFFTGQQFFLTGREFFYWLKIFWPVENFFRGRGPQVEKFI